MDEACYRLADRIYQMERSKIKGCPSQSDNTDSQWLNESRGSTQCTALSEEEHADAMLKRHLGRKHSNDFHFTDGQEEHSPGNVMHKLRIQGPNESVYNIEPRSRQTSNADLTVEPSARKNKIDHDDIAIPGVYNVTKADKEHKKLHHVSAYHTEPPIEFFDPFEDDHDEAAWPLALGSHMWSLVVRGPTPLNYHDTTDINIEGTISSFYSKEGTL